jgi:hypothetical protein
MLFSEQLFGDFTSTIGPCLVAISARNTKVYKICELCKAIFSAFYNISQTKLCNFTHFSMLFPGIYFFCQDKKLVYNGNCL